MLHRKVRTVFAFGVLRPVDARTLPGVTPHAGLENARPYWLLVFERQHRAAAEHGAGVIRRFRFDVQYRGAQRRRITQALHKTHAECRLRKSRRARCARLRKIRTQALRTRQEQSRRFNRIELAVQVVLAESQRPVVGGCNVHPELQQAGTRVRVDIAGRLQIPDELFGQAAAVGVLQHGVHLRVVATEQLER